MADKGRMSVGHWWYDTDSGQVKTQVLSRHRFSLVSLGPRATWFPWVLEQMLRWFPFEFQVAATCYPCSPLPTTKFRANSPYICNMLNDHCHRVSTHFQLILLLLLLLLLFRTRTCCCYGVFITNSTQTALKN